MNTGMHRTRHASLDYTVRAPTIADNQDEEWYDFLSTSMMALATGDTHKNQKHGLDEPAVHEEPVFQPSGHREGKIRSNSMCESLTSSTGSSPVGTTQWRPLGRRSNASSATNNQTEHLVKTSSFRDVVASCLSSSGSSIEEEDDEGSSDEDRYENQRQERLASSDLDAHSASVRPAIIDVDPTYAVACLPVLTSFSPTATHVETPRAGPLFHAKSPVLSTRKESQTWQIQQDEEFLTSPRLGASRHRSNSIVRGGISLVPSESASSNQHDNEYEAHQKLTKDTRAASVDFTFQHSINPPLPPPEEPYPRMRAKSFSFSSGYGAGGYSMGTNNNKPIQPPIQEFATHAIRPMHPMPPPPQSNAMNVGAGGMRPPRVIIPNDPPMPPYHQHQYTPPLPYRRYSTDAFSMQQYPESRHGDMEGSGRPATNGRGMRSYSMECVNYGATRPSRSQSIEGMLYPPPPPPPQDQMPMNRLESNGMAFEWPPAPPLPPDTRESSMSSNRVSYSMVPPEAYYEVEFKRGRQELFAGRAGYNPGDYVKVEADRGEDIGRVVRRASDLSQLQGAESATASESDPLGRSKRPDSSMKKVLCLASPRECEMLAEQRKEEHEVFEVCKSKVRQRLLPMNVIDAEYQFDRHKLTFFFEADRRIDFRELVRDLFAIYKTRIWLQQVVPGSKKLCCDYEPAN